MGVTPERYHCDFCANEIQPGDKRVTMEVPLTLAERRAIADEWEKGNGGRAPGVFGNMMPTIQLVAPTYPVLACVPCINSILPDVIALRETKIKEAIANMARQRERRAQADAEEVGPR